MKLSLLGSIVIILSIHATAFADQVDIGKCYSINGPANIRNHPNGDVVDSLPDGEIVFIKDKKGVGWFEINYSANHGQGECPPRGRLKNGWTYKNNLEQLPEPLEQLVKEGKVLIAGRELFFSEQERTGAFLGADVKCNKADDICKPITPLLVNVYCLNGKRSRNEVMSFTIWSWDEGSFYIKLNLKNALPKDDCIVVHGLIENTKQTQITPDSLQKSGFCKVGMDEHYFCKYKKGDFNNDGITDVIVTDGRIGAPSAEDWTLYESDDTGKIKRLGNVGSHVAP